METVVLVLLVVFLIGDKKMGILSLVRELAPVGR